MKGSLDIAFLLSAFLRFSSAIFMSFNDLDEDSNDMVTIEEFAHACGSSRCTRTLSDASGGLAKERRPPFEVLFEANGPHLAPNSSNQTSNNNIQNQPSSNPTSGVKALAKVAYP